MESDEFRTLYGMTHANAIKTLDLHGTAPHRVQQGKAVTRSGNSQSRHLPWGYPGSIRSESPPGTLTSLNAKPQRMTLLLDP
ncbi:hypothetical protein AVEN_68673-1 [Araneus ventricosus]|uniref:Uncharacterized protein n=1 Tax=Araneus ventricosus TaxID=182803 RepID=A0A4Y2RHD4_ARAVE|nr:hypothetical protein AVEN_68673-1 [Araneus ventricosus]